MTFEITVTQNKKYRIVTNDDELILTTPYHWRGFIERPLETLVRAILKNIGQVGIRRLDDEDGNQSHRIR